MSSITGQLIRPKIKAHPAEQIVFLKIDKS